MCFRSNAALSVLLILVLLSALSGCGDTPPIAPKVAVPSTVPIVSAPITTTTTTTTAPATTAAPSVIVPVIPSQIDPPETGIKLDAVKYPQDTPEKAFESLAKALETNDLAYQIAWLSTPDFTFRMLAKYKSIAATVAANQGEDKVKGRQMLLKSIREMQAAKMTAQSEINGVKCFRFGLGEKLIIQLELQKDGRWCMNPRVREKTIITKGP